MKTEIRSSLLKKLKNLSADAKSRASAIIQNELKVLLKNQKGYWAGYQNLSDEPAFSWSEVASQIDWCFPVVEKETLKFRTSAKTFQISPLGIKEPSDGEEVDLEEINGCVIPGVSFDKKGVRLGRGKGYYDRALAQYNGKKIGVCYETSFCEELPQEVHDVQCERIVTEKSVYLTGPSEGDSKWS